MNASRGVIVIKLRRNTLARSGECRTDFIRRPRERLYSPLFALLMIILNNILGAIGKDDIRHRESRRRE